MRRSSVAILLAASVALRPPQGFELVSSHTRRAQNRRAAPESDWSGVGECGDLDVEGAAVYQAASLDDAVSQPPVTGRAESVPALSKRAP
jgi:hypothetical protein